MTYRFVIDELSGSVAKSFVADVCRFHRIQGSMMFHEVAEYVKAELLKLGLGDAVIEQFSADGANKYWTYVSPVGWAVRSAELRLVEPREELICSYEDLPQCLHTFSNATPAEGVDAELIDVGTGMRPSDYEGNSVKGKFVLAQAAPSMFMSWQSTSTALSEYLRTRLRMKCLACVRASTFQTHTHIKPSGLRRRSSPR
jgi:hypothetical protein